LNVVFAAMVTLALGPRVNLPWTSTDVVPMTAPVVGSTLSKLPLLWNLRVREITIDLTVTKVCWIVPQETS
jgi:hypothetical protein